MRKIFSNSWKGLVNADYTPSRLEKTLCLYLNTTYFIERAENKCLDAKPKKIPDLKTLKYFHNI